MRFAAIQPTFNAKNHRANLDRLTLAEYSIDASNEAFTIDDLGNRDSVIVRDGNNVNYDIDNLSNRYDSVGGNTLAYDAAGNLTADKDGYQYEYDYENRIAKITKDSNDIAEFSYDALGRRIKKRDSIADTNNIYYYNDNWQILCDYNDAGTPQSWFAYGNYIDEVVLMSKSFTSWLSVRYYIHDHLYSPAALMGATGASPIERYEYDAYGNCYILEPNFAPDPDGKTDYGNPYYFTGRQLDFLDGGNLKIQYNRNRYYDQYTGRWLTHDPMVYVDGMNVYEYVSSNPIQHVDPHGLAIKIDSDYVRKVDPELVRYFRNLWELDDFGDIGTIPGTRRGLLDRRYEAMMKAMMYGIARDYIVTSTRWRILLLNWYFEMGDDEFLADGFWNPYCQDIHTNSGFQALFECWIAKFHGCSKRVPEEGRHFKIDKSHVWWHYYFPYWTVPGGFSAYTAAMHFLGSYEAEFSAEKTGDPCVINVSVKVTNVTNWSSASKTLEFFTGEVIGLLPNHGRGAGPYLPSRGGNYKQTFTFKMANQQVTDTCSLSP